MQANQRLKKTISDIGVRIKSLRLTRNISLTELSKQSGVSKAALSQLESGVSNPRIDTLEAIAIALRLPLGDLLVSQQSPYPFFQKNNDLYEQYSQQMLFRIGQGNISEIWHLQMKPFSTINSPAHSKGTHEHILVSQGELFLKIDKVEIAIKSGDFYAFSGDKPHMYTCKESDTKALVVMSYITV